MLGRSSRPSLLAGVLLLTAAPAFAADAPERAPTPVVYADTVRVNASKSRSRLADLATTATILTAEQIRLGTAHAMQDVLAPVPGAHILDLSGSGTDGQVETRGFAAQGTTSSMAVLIDGIPVNDFEDGKVDWNLLDPSQVDHVEFLRGPTSFLYGSTTLSGLVNLVTRTPGQGPTAWGQVGGGSFGREDAAGGAAWGGGRWQGALSGSFQHLDGYRDHSMADIGSGYAFARTTIGSHWNLRARLLANQGNEQVPGPLGDPLWKTSPTQAGTPDDKHDAKMFESALELDGALSPRLSLSALGSAGVKHVEATETIVGLFSTLDRTSHMGQGRGELRLHWQPTGAHSPDLLVGTEVRKGALQSRYFNPDPAGDQLASAGDVQRTTGGVYALSRAPLTHDLVFNAGARIDWLRSQFHDPTSSGAEPPHDDLRAFSPTLGLNYALPTAGNAWVTYAGAFKAPELEQLYDVRPYDVGGPAPITISSNTLKPQQDDHWDAGERLRLGSVWLENSVYWARARNELGFDYSTFKIANIDRSRHFGVETQLQLPTWSGVTASLSYAYARATFDGGAHDGHQINTVPEDQVFVRVTYQHRWHGSLTAEVDNVSRQWIDEDDTLPIPDYSVVHLGFNQALGAVELFGTVRNVGDVKYATTGYVGADGSSQYFPAAGRSFSVGLRMRLAR